jgi:hypothetical protein
MAYLEYINGPFAGEKISLSGNRLIITRTDNESDSAAHDRQVISIHYDRGVSNPHCKITTEKEGYFIEDLKSTNGSRIGLTDELITSKARLTEKTYFRLNNSLFCFHEQGGGSEGTL